VKDAAHRGRRLAAVDAKKPAVYKFRANDGDFDRYQDRLNVKGWQLDAFNANPVLLYNHDAGDGGFLGLGAKNVLPIGKARVYVEGDALMSEVEFDQDDEFALKVERKVAKGYLNAVSVRYLMHKYHENERGGVDCDEQELLELSIVTIPGNQRATRVKGLLNADEQELVDAFAKALAGHLSKNTGGERIAPEHPLHEEPSMTPEQIKAMQEENARLKAAADCGGRRRSREGGRGEEGGRRGARAEGGRDAASRR
jgi:phage head maturation protease